MNSRRMRARHRLSENPPLEVPADPLGIPTPVGYDEDVRRVVQQAMLRLAIRRAVRAKDRRPSDGVPFVGRNDSDLRSESTGDPDVAALLDAVVGNQPGAETALLEIVYVELRAIAGSFFKRQSSEHTLQPTALVHEAYLKLMGGAAGSTPGPNGYNNRAHFIAVAAKAMRQVLIDHARRKRAEKRGGANADRVTLTGLALDEADTPIDALDIHEHLERLALIDERQAKVVELRFFAGLGVPEVAQVLGVSDRTVELDWRMARAWLRRAMGESKG